MTTPPGDAGSFGCEAFGALLPAYRAGTLDEPRAWQVEWHAAHCRVCEPLLDAGNPLADTLRRDPHLQAAIPLSALERSAMRESALRESARRASAVTGRRTRDASHRRGRVMLIAAAAVLAVIVWRGGDDERAGTVVESIAARVPDGTAGMSPLTVPPADGPSSAPMATAVRVASAEASAEFDVLREAARELERALTKAPDDATLRALRDARDDRRRELESRVARVTE